MASSQSLLIEEECFNTIPVLCPAHNNNIIISLHDLEDFDFMQELEDTMAIEPVVPVWTKFVNNGMKDPKFISAINSVNTHGKKFANFNVSNPNNNQMPISEKKNQMPISEKENQLSIQNCSPEKMNKTDQNGMIEDLEKCITEVKDFFSVLWPFSDSDSGRPKVAKGGDLSQISEVSEMESNSFSFGVSNSDSDYSLSSSMQGDSKSNDANSMVPNVHSFLKNKPVCDDININNSYDNMYQ